MAVKMKGWNDQIYKGLTKLDILGQIRKVVQDQTEETHGEIPTQRQQLELHAHEQIACYAKSMGTDCMPKSLVTEEAGTQVELESTQKS